MVSSCRTLKGVVYGEMNPCDAMPKLLSMCEAGTIKLDELVTQRHRVRLDPPSTGDRDDEQPHERQRGDRGGNIPSRAVAADADHVAAAARHSADQHSLQCDDGGSDGYRCACAHTAG